MSIRAVPFLLLFACSGADDDKADTGEADTDTDTDTDADTDTDTVATGLWVGECVGAAFPDGSTSTFPIDVSAELELVEDDGAISGTFTPVDTTATAGVWSVEGTRAGADLALEVLTYTTGGLAPDIRFELAIAGDAMDGTMIAPAISTGYTPAPIPCTFVR